MRVSRLLTAALLPSLLMGRALAQVSDDVRVPVADLELAARFGAGLPDGPRLFMLPKALEATRSVVPGDPALARYQFGTQDFSTTSVTGQEFEPHGGTTLSKFRHGFFFASGVTLVAQADLHLDNGVRWDGVLWWARDFVTEDLTLVLEETCWPFSAGLPTVTVLGTGSTSGSTGDQIYFTAINPPVTVANGLCTYSLAVLTTSSVGAGALQFNRARAGWFRQVSPAPGTATFMDVPTGHEQFRFVEALVAAGITAGCGGGNFCPDAPLTRGQMAVFLSVALGLHWPF